MTKDTAAVVKIQVTPGNPVELPNGKFVASADFAREGMDLHLTSPEGHEIVIEGYFSQNPLPNIVTPDGARLSPDLVDAFLPPVHGREYAGVGGDTVSDVSPAGQITEIVGTVTISRADGSKVTAAAGTPVYPGDVIETSADGAANILFADNTTFAISESARLAVNEYAYNAEEHSGNTFFSMLQGVFVYTSGLIGHNDPHDVRIETPVGSIGIRGTIVAGDIRPAGEDSKITIVQGAITVTNDGGRIDLDNNLETASFSGYQQPPQDMGQIDTQNFTSYYSAAETVASGTFAKVYDGTYVKMDAAIRAEHATPDAAGSENSNDAPADAPADTPSNTPTDAAPAAPGQPVTGQPATEGDVQTVPQSTGETPPPAAAEGAEPPATTPPPIFIQPPAVLPPPSSSGSFSPPAGSNFGAPGGSTFGSGTGGTTGTGTGGGTGSGTTMGTVGSGTTTGGMGGEAGTGTDGGSIGVFPDVNFNFSQLYTKNTPETTDDGIPLFGLGWPANALVGQGIVTNYTGNAASYEMVYTDGVNTHTLNASGAVVGKTYQLDTGTTGAGNNMYDTHIVDGQDLFSFNSTTGAITILDPLGMVQQLNGNMQFTLKAKNSAGIVIGTEDFVFLMSGFTGPVFLGTATNDGNTTGSPIGTDGIAVVSPGAFVQTYGGNDRVSIANTATGNKIFLGAGDDLAVVHAPGFGNIDGGAGDDRVVLNSASFYDFTASGSSKFKGIETIELGGTPDAADMKLSLQNIFEMTDQNHTLTVKVNDIVGTPNQVGRLFIDTDAFTVTTGTLYNDPNTGGTGNSVGAGVVTMTGVYNGVNVTLVIDQGGSTNGVVVTNI